MKNGMLFIALTAVLFSTLEPASKLMAGQIHPLMLTALRFLLGGALLMPFSLTALRSLKVRPDPAAFLKMAALGVLLVGVSMGLLQTAVFLAESAALMAIIFSSNAVFTIVLGALVLRERITLRKLAALALCLLGILLGAGGGQGEPWQAVALAILAALAFSAYTVLSKRLMASCPGIVQNGISFVAGGLVLLVLVALFGEGSLTILQPSSIGMLLYLGIAVTGIGYWGFFRAIDISGAFAASLVFFIKPVLTPLATLIILGSGNIGPETLLALALVVAGSVIVTLDKRASDAAQAVHQG